jgi:hypothetical protein
MSILAVGCSFTAGAELPNPAESAWPNLIAKLNNRSVKNLGLGGASNDRIFRLVVEETAQQRFDLVIVQWTEPSRMEIWNSRQRNAMDVNIGKMHSQQFGLNWLETYYQHHYDDFHAHRKWATQILSLQGYLKSIDQPYVMVSLNGLDQKLYTGAWNSVQYLWDGVDTMYYPGWPFEGITMWQGNCPKGPGGHPLELGHERIAEKINEHIRNLGWLP